MAVLLVMYLITFRQSIILIVPPCRPGSEKIYGFSEFTCSLNEQEEGVAPTDCRFRPDQRLMEEQDFDKANDEKVPVS